MPKSLRYFVLTKTTSHEPNMTMDSLDRIKFQGPFCVDQMSYGCLDRPNVLQGHWRVLDSLVGLQTWPRHVWAADPLAFCSSGTKASCLTVNPGMVFPHLRLIFFFLFQPLMQLFSYLFFTILVLTNSHKTNEHLCFSLCFSPSGEDANGQWNAETWVVGERMNRSLHPGLLPVVKKSVNCWRTGAHSISLSRTGFVAWELSLPINYHFLLNLFVEIETCFKFYLCFFFNLGGKVKI